MKYTARIVFDADSDEEALEQLFGTDAHPEWGAMDSFESIHDVTVTDEAGRVVE